MQFSSTAVLNLTGNAVALTGVLVASLIIDWRAGLMIGVAAVIAVALMYAIRRVAVVPSRH